MPFSKANALHGSCNVDFRKLGCVPFPDASVRVFSRRKNIVLRAISRSTRVSHFPTQACVWFYDASMRVISRRTTIAVFELVCVWFAGAEPLRMYKIVLVLSNCGMSKEHMRSQDKIIINVVDFEKIESWEVWIKIVIRQLLFAQCCTISFFAHRSTISIYFAQCSTISIYFAQCSTISFYFAQCSTISI